MIASGLAALIAGRPRGIHVGRIDEVQPGVDERVENRKRSRFVGGPAEYIAAEHKRRDLQFRVSNTALLHDFSRLYRKRKRDTPPFQIPQRTWRIGLKRLSGAARAPDQRANPVRD